MKLRFPGRNKAKTAVDRNCRQGRIYRNRSPVGGIEHVVPKQARNPLPMMLGLHEQVVKVLPVSQGDVAEQVRSGLRKEVEEVWSCETSRDCRGFQALQEGGCPGRGRIRGQQGSYFSQQAADGCAIAFIAGAYLDVHGGTDAWIGARRRAASA